MNAADLRVLRNTVVAKYGYVFSSPDLDQHFRTFPWYAPKEASVDNLLSGVDKALVLRIKRFENQVAAAHTVSEKGIIGIWKEFTGGADQAGTIISLSPGGQFAYTYNEWFIQRTTTLTGRWKYADSRIILDVATQDLTLGGYYEQEPDDIVIKDGVRVKIVYDHDLIIRLPIETSDGIPGYENNAMFAWRRIGSDIFAGEK